MDRFALTKLSYGMYAIGTKDAQNRFCGCIANSLMQITAEPATVALSINHDNYTNQCIKDTKGFSVCVLGEKTNPLIIGTFGFRSAKDIDKFANVNHKTAGDLPVCTDSCAYLLCKLISTTETSTHTIFMASVEDCEILSDDTPMTYAYYHNVIKGKSPKSAPTYITQS